MTAYYNEFDPKAAAWLRELIADGHIAPGDVDERSILDITPNDLRGYTQCHFFAGIGGWSLALRLAGWPDDRPVWTGSCPCQPFSEAGARAGLADERHLWPYWRYLIAQRTPGVVFGEQVEAAIRYGWLDLVRDDMEALGYAFAAVGLPAACVGAPHIRQRLWFVADTGGQRQQFDAQLLGVARRRLETPRRYDVDGRGGSGAALSVAHSNGDRFAPAPRSEFHNAQHHAQSRSIDGRQQLGVALGDAERTGLAQRLGLAGVPGWALGTGAGQAAVGAGVHAEPGGLGSPDGQREDPQRGVPEGSRAESARSLESLGVEHAEGIGWVERRSESSGRRAIGGRGDGFWDNAVWIDCKDGKRRPIEPGIFPLASGVQGRVGLLRGSGNAIVPQVAAAFIQEYIATRSVI